MQRLRLRNLEERARFSKIDFPQAHGFEQRWPTSPCGFPQQHGDGTADHRLFVGCRSKRDGGHECRHPQGHQFTTLTTKIGDHVDATRPSDQANQAIFTPWR